MYKMKVLKGRVFNRWSVLELDTESKKGTRWLCKCKCGTKRSVLSYSLLNGDSQSCGCLQKEGATTHGMSRHPLYFMWSNMMQRCYNENHERYGDYGGRGIYVYPEWHNPDVFIRWARCNGYKKKLELDRRDNDKEYNPSNCRFVTPSVNSSNIRVKDNNTSGYTGVVWVESKQLWRLRIILKGKVLKEKCSKDKRMLA